MSGSATLTPEEIQELAETWFRGLNEHWPMVRMLALLAREDLKMVFPEATLTSLEEFETWYGGVIRTFFDQDHIINSIRSDVRGDEAVVKLTVTWKARQWNPPAATSERILMDADQTWTVRRSAQTGKPVIVSYAVDKLEPREGQ